MSNKPNPKNGDLRIWWISQVPMKAFHVSVPDLKTAKFLMNTAKNTNCVKCSLLLNERTSCCACVSCKYTNRLAVVELCRFCLVRFKESNEYDLFIYYLGINDELADKSYRLWVNLANPFGPAQPIT
jgi:hypothetical protein